MYCWWSTRRAVAAIRPNTKAWSAWRSAIRRADYLFWGFPSNDFGNQEPGNEKQIAEFCRLTYGVNFPMFEKIHVTGAMAHPFYRTLSALSGTTPKWNFHKYLIGRNGQVVASFPSHVAPEDTALIDVIDQQLAK